MSTNPYESPSHESTLHVSTSNPTSFTSRRQLPAFLVLLVWLYPILLVISIYGTWLAAWISLGHTPRPSLDDPKDIGIVVDVPYLISGLLMMGIPVGALAGLALPLLASHVSWLKRTSFFLLMACSWGLAIAFLRWDPLLVIQWFMD